MIFYFLIFLWLIRETKSILFWLYLWQLKEYRIGRFIDHFQTEKGKELFSNHLFILKIILFFYVLFLYFYTKLLPLPFYIFWILVLIVFYFFESAKFFLDLIQKKLKKPVLTKKTIFLISFAIILEIIFIYFLFLKVKSFYWFTFSTLIFDLLTLFIVSVIVLLFQIPTVFLRNKIIEKAKKKRERFKSLLVIGITGSYGKTSTKEFLNAILSSKFKVLSTPAHQNTDIAISEVILKKLNESFEIFIVEMAAYKLGEIRSPCQIVKPKIGILTGINEQHMATFGSQENIVKTKFELIDSLPEKGTAILNWDNNFIKAQNKSFKLKIIKYSISEKENIWAENIKVEKESVFFRAICKDGDSADFRVNVLGSHNVLNILGAASCAKELGMTLREIAKACEKITLEENAMKLKKGVNEINIIDSTYSANPDGVISHLEYLKIWPGKKAIIMPCLIELGKASIEVHKRIGQKIAEVCDLAIIITKERFKEIKEGAINSGQGRVEILFMENPEKIFEKIKTFYNSPDVILLEGRIPKQLIQNFSFNTTTQC